MSVKLCIVNGCNGIHKGIGYCQKHYRRLLRYKRIELLQKQIRFDFKNKINKINKTRSEIARTYYEKNSHTIKARISLKRLKTKKAMPLWANNFFIEEIYDLASIRTKMFGFKWHVDHVIPLNGRNVSGLHVETNLQVIPAKLNLIKGNKYN